MTKTSLILAAALLGACGSSSGETTDATTADATTITPDAHVTLDGPIASACDDLPLTFSIDEATATTRLEALLADLRAHSPDVYFRESIDGTRALVQLASISAPLPTDVEADPRADVMTWLATASPATFAAGEWAPDPAFDVDPADVGDGDVLFARMIRTSAGGTPWPNTYPDRYVQNQGLSMIVARFADVWILREVTFDPAIVLADATDATLLTTCAPTTPTDLLAQHTFDGLEFEGCVEVGNYTYTAQPGDTVEVQPGLVFTLAAPVDGRASWNPARPATLTVAAPHYWPRVAYADAFCDGRVGWSVTVHAITGAVQRVAPGILCVVC